MKLGKKLSLASIIINIIIFFYFVIALIQVNALDMLGLLIGGFGILSSLIADIVGAILD